LDREVPTKGLSVRYPNAQHLSYTLLFLYHETKTFDTPTDIDLLISEMSARGGLFIFTAVPLKNKILEHCGWWQGELFMRRHVECCINGIEYFYFKRSIISTETMKM
jgi:hypothetical protein